MKKTILLALGLLCFAATLSAQSGRYYPMTTWPYVYEDFQPGTLTTYNGNIINYDKVNICLSNGHVHYVKDGIIMEADAKSTAALNINGKKYIRISGYMVMVLQETAGGAVALLSVIDEERMGRANIGYGTSAIASTRNVSVTALSGELPFSVNKAMDVVSHDKYDGERLPVREITGICYKGLFVPASKTDVLKINGIDKEAVKDFIKNEKIKFSRVEDLVKLTEFLYAL